MTGMDVAQLLAGVAQGEDGVWSPLIDRYLPILLAAAARLGLTPAERDDAVQQTWLRLLEHRGDLRDAACLPGWLATVARRECLAVRKDRDRMSPADKEWDATDSADPAAPDVVERMAAAERARAVRLAVRQLPTRERALVELLLDPGDLSYAEISVRLGIPMGSIGPLRRRSLRRLRRLMETGSGPLSSF